MPCKHDINSLTRDITSRQTTRIVRGERESRQDTRHLRGKQRMSCGGGMCGYVGTTTGKAREGKHQPYAVEYHRRVCHHNAARKRRAITALGQYGRRVRAGKHRRIEGERARESAYNRTPPPT